MRAAILVFPGTNREKDLADAFLRAGAPAPVFVHHKETALPDGIDIACLPGGFSYGDYLRCGAMAAQAPILKDVVAKAAKGMRVLAICNGFQIATEAGLLPGALIRNAGLKFICRRVALRVERDDTGFSTAYAKGQTVHWPVAHNEGNYVASAEDIARLEGEGRVLLRYAEDCNGSINDIAGILDETGRILGMMPHPENATDPLHGGTDGLGLFKSILESVA